MEELAWAAAGRDRIEWDRTITICFALLSPWLSLSELLTGEKSDFDIASLHPYGIAGNVSVSPGEQKGEETVKAGWKGFLKSPKTRRFANARTK